MNWRKLPSSGDGDGDGGGGYVNRHRDKRMHFSPARYVLVYESGQRGKGAGREASRPGETEKERASESEKEREGLSNGTVRAPEQNVALTYCRCIAYVRT